MFNTLKDALFADPDEYYKEHQVAKPGLLSALKTDLNVGSAFKGNPKETEDALRAEEVSQLIKMGAFRESGRAAPESKNYVYQGVLEAIKAPPEPPAPTPTTVVPTQVPTTAPVKTAPVKPTPKPNPAYPTPTAPPKYPNEPALPEDTGQFLESTVFPITREYGIPDAVAASQWATEGGRVKENVQNNLFGIMRGGKLIQYPSVEANVKDYALTVQNILKNKGYDLSQMSDAYEVLKALQSGDRPRYEAHNADPYLYVRNILNTPEFRFFYK